MSQYEGGQIMPPLDVLMGFAAKLGMSLSELTGESATSPAGGSPWVFPQSYEAVVLRAGKTDRVAEENLIALKGEIPIPRSMVEERGWRLEKLAVLPADGWSMSPTISHREPLVINLDETTLISGKTYAIQAGDDGPRVKRLFDDRDGRIRVVSDNLDKINFPDEWITPDSQARIVGRAYRLGDLFSGET